MQIIRRTSKLFNISNYCACTGSRNMSETPQYDLGDMRAPYHNLDEGFDVQDLTAKEPIGQFTDWFEAASKDAGIKEPNAMALATATKDGIPSCRMVLLKGYGVDGFRFFTNYNSRKGKELAENPRASLVFHWDNRSVRVEGVVEKLSEESSTDYFHRRSKDSQIGAALSQQSSRIENRQVLINDAKTLYEKYQDVQEIPKPEFWGGYIIKPHHIEFWQGQTTRVHDRLVFRRPEQGEALDPAVTHQGDDGWLYERLAP